MAIPIINDWQKYFSNPHEGLGSSYERVILNKMLFRFANAFGIKTILETPSFGFTGVSGINLMGLAKAGFAVSLEDHDEQRLSLVSSLWQSLELPLEVKLNNTYSSLDYPSQSMDMGFNFSALWFVSNLDAFLSELCRVVSKLIIICVPNRDGFGYKMQIKDYSPTAYPNINPEYIDPESICAIMRKHGWKLLDHKYIDCPPWPDIGMSKELFIRRMLGNNAPTKPESTTPDKPVSILPYYAGRDEGFDARMMRYSFVEAIAPIMFKKYWAHHRYLAFAPKD
jgi:hypothetical protein